MVGYKDKLEGNCYLYTVGVCAYVLRRNEQNNYNDQTSLSVGNTRSRALAHPH